MKRAFVVLFVVVFRPTMYVLFKAKAKDVVFAIDWTLPCTAEDCGGVRCGRPAALLVVVKWCWGLLYSRREMWAVFF